jgi:uncharacterized cofD-like protein
MDKERKFVVIGGGTGTYTVLSGLKKISDNITAVVTMMDSGGSSGRLRDEFGQLPAGDVRQALVALSNDSSIMRQLFNYRYEKGEGLQGHSFGNLFLTALAEVTGGMENALEEASRILNIKGKVLPVTLSKADLIAEYDDGLVVKGEKDIDAPAHDGKLHINKLSLDTKVEPFEKTLAAISQADVIIIGPGDLYTSLIPNLLVPKVADAICNSKAKKIYIVNLMTKFGQTFGFKASDFVSELEKYLGKCLNFVLINSKELPKEIIELYKAENDTPVIDDLNEEGFKVIRADLLAADPIQKAAGDVLQRSLIRHDSDKISKVISSLV